MFRLKRPNTYFVIYDDFSCRNYMTKFALFRDSAVGLYIALATTFSVIYGFMLVVPCRCGYIELSMNCISYSKSRIIYLTYIVYIIIYLENLSFGKKLKNFKWE